MLRPKTLKPQSQTLNPSSQNVSIIPSSRGTVVAAALAAVDGAAEAHGSFASSGSRKQAPRELHHAITTFKTGPINPKP